MSPAEKQQLKGLYIATGLYYGQNIPDEALRLYVEDLEDLPFAAVAEALKELRRESKATRFPLPANIRAKINPAEDPDSEANRVVAEIIHSISHVGPYASPMLSPVAAEVVRAEGGWLQVCELATNDNLTFLRAQWRDLALARIKSGRPLGQERPALSDQRHGGSSGELTRLGDLMGRIGKEPDHDGP